ncbi:hypothetical protein DTO169E5_9173 [Paecilomyces variotii]|nr:hypothetical protein DTO169E5_9173 [Paecilomyces variotii]
MFVQPSGVPNIRGSLLYLALTVATRARIRSGSSPFRAHGSRSVFTPDILVHLVAEFRPQPVSLDIWEFIMI